MKNKQQILDEVSQRLIDRGTMYPKWEITRIIEPFMEVIIDNLNQGEEINISNLGTFKIKTTEKRKYYNIQKGCNMYSTKRRNVQFTPTRRFKSIIDNPTQQAEE